MDKLEKGIHLYTSGLPLLKAWRESGCARNKLQEALVERKLMRSNKDNSRRYTVNHDFFETIDTEAKAYWLGFIYADGYVSRRKTGQLSVGIALGRKDRGHLEKFVEALDSNYPIKDYISNSFGTQSEYSRILITSDKMFHDLVSKGVVEHKTMKLTFPTEDIVPNHLIHHFIRGYFDGDGSFSAGPNGHYYIKIEGMKDFLLELSWKCGYLTSEEKLYTRHKDRQSSYSLEFARKDEVLTVANFMYRDATVYLDRKYTRYLLI